MAPQASRKRKSKAMEETPQAMTPTGSPAHKKMKITQSQKQALIDNLQLEITERARKLRAHYALQCADLRSRIERRVNRIPVATRKMTMGELMESHANRGKPKLIAALMQHENTATDVERPLPALPEEKTANSPIQSQIQPPSFRIKKRKSSNINIASDKENEIHQALEMPPVAKNTKRGKAVPNRATSRTNKSASVLSPRSHNSRTLPRSPIKEYPTNPASPGKSMIARPISPLKPASPFKAAASAATSAISASMYGMFAGKLSRTNSCEKTTTTATRGKMLPPPRPALSSPHRAISAASNHSVASDTSNSSTTTTVVTKATRGRAAKMVASEILKKSPAAKKGTVAKTKTAMKKTAGAGANKKVVVAEPAVGRRVLRKRN